MTHSPPTFSKAIVVVLLALTLAGCGAGAAAAPAATASPPTAPAADAALPTRINLNTAAQADFLAIPGVGSRMVREFMEYRPYTSIVQFRREIGKYVDAAQVAEYEKYVFVPIKVNESDAETLKQIPGVDDSTAAALIAGRPYASNDDFLAKLAASVSESDLAVGKSYLATP